MDLFAAALLELFDTGETALFVERDDGFTDRDDLSWYLLSYRDFPLYEKRALKFARGRVLDLGCAAGRHALYLQKRGLQVVAADASPALIDLAKTRGARDARVLNACARLPFGAGEFQTVLLLGNNLGLCGTVPRFRRMLRELYRITSPDAQILATTRMLDLRDTAERAYAERNIVLSRAPHQVRMRLYWQGIAGKWFDFLLFAPTEVMQIAAREKWRVRELFCEDDFARGYAVVLEKMK